MKMKKLTRSRLGLLLLALAVAVTLTVDISAQRSRSNDGRRYLREFSQAFQDVAAEVTPAVVHIKTTVTVRENPHGRDFLDMFGIRPPAPREFERSGVGSGVIIDARNGYIVTNNHVVEGAESGKNVEVSVINGKETHRYKAEWIRTDPSTDIAVLKIDAENLVEAELGDSDALQVGEWVLAIGNPFGFDQSVTAGIVSYKGRRPERQITQYDSFIQTDAAINPGNSGGPMVDLDGKVVGINTAIVSGGWQASFAGVGLAIPIEMVEKVVDELIEHGEVTRGYIGIYYQELNDTLKEAFDLDVESGAIVTDVIPGSPADDAGLVAGDVIVALDGIPIEKNTDLSFRVADREPGETIKLDVDRKSGRETISLTLAKRPDDAAPRSGGATPDIGLTVQNLTPELKRQFGYEPDDRGVIVMRAEPNSPAAEVGIQPGDLILEVGRNNKVNSVSEFQKAVMAAIRAKEEFLLVLYQRGAVPSYAVIQLQPKE